MIPMVFINIRTTEVITKLIKIKNTIYRIMINETVAFWEIEFLNENMTTKMVVDYLLHLESQQEDVHKRTREDRIEMAKGKLGEAVEACEKAIETFERSLAYEPV
jgi:hypothetical protein